ncbi:hypothetical protein Y032_0002g1133 [Ancylostoma ceylanicum]|uniref:G-protein coupled receptors family 1 profile domain-containing protein n=1 Tax=Ancylostoma ceylanicum TaxID=53326 RepID=A0A016VZN0_9BILA|nr:hypothetical protein Y032_0002g1133 [Ancylostoma ceylanicum]
MGEARSAAGRIRRCDKGVPAHKAGEAGSRDMIREAGTNPCSFEEQQRLSVLASQRRTTTILASMVLLFGFTWLPHNVYTLVYEYDDGIFHNGETDNTYIVSMVAHLISMTTNVANPILYAWLNPSFKNMLLTSIRGKVRAPTTLSTKETIIRVSMSDTAQEKTF